MVNNPNIRFAGFADEWEAHKLGELLTRTHRPTVNRSLVTVGESQTKLRTQENQGYNSKLTDIDTTKYAGINFGDVLVDLSSYSRGFYISTMDGLTSKAYHVLSHDFKEYRLIFLKYILVNRQILKQLPGLTPVGVRQGKSLPVGDVLTLNVSLPSEAKEQQKIGSVFSTLDHKIGLEERQIALLKGLKKGYLQKMFPKNGATVPELRFAGFADDWEERKLGDITGYIKGYAFKSKDYQNDGYRIIRVSDLGKDNIRASNDPIFVSEEIAKQQIRYSIKENEIIITTVGSKAEMKESAVGRPVIVTESSGYLLNQNLVKVYGKSKFNSYFIYTQLLQTRYTDYISMIERGNANQANIAINDLWNYRLLTPTYGEQQKIGSFFKQLDVTITRHQRKLDLLKDLKKGLLQQMFL